MSVRYSSTLAKLVATPNKFNAKSSAFNLKPALPDGLFFHPAPAAPNPEITPKALLPENDIRKQSDFYYPEQDKYINENINFMPVISNTNIPKNYKFDSSIVEEIQKLRDQGVSRSQIKQKLNVSDHFISLTTKPNPQTVLSQAKLEKKQTKKWSVKTKKAKTIKLNKQFQWERDL